RRRAPVEVKQAAQPPDIGVDRLQRKAPVEAGRGDGGEVEDEARLRRIRYLANRVLRDVEFAELEHMGELASEALEPGRPVEAKGIEADHPLEAEIAAAAQEELQKIEAKESGTAGEEDRRAGKAPGLPETPANQGEVLGDDGVFHQDTHE